VENNKLQVINNIGNELTVIKTPLLYHPVLKDFDIQKCDIIDENEKEILLATLNNPKIRTLDVTRDGGINGLPTDPYSSLIDIITLTIWEWGVSEEKFSKRDQKIFIPIAIDEIKRKYKNLTIEEVKIAFRNGVRREYGEFYGINITTINFWLDTYIESEKHEAMLRLPYIKPSDVEKPKELSEEEKLKLHTDWLNKVYNYFENYKKNNIYDFYDFKNTFYLYCKKLGLINLDEGQQQAIWDKAVEELKLKHHPKNAKNFGQRINFKNIYDKLKLDEVDKDGEALIINHARKITIRWFFKKLVKENKELKAVIEEAELNLKK